MSIVRRSLCVQNFRQNIDRLYGSLDSQFMYTLSYRYLRFSFNTRNFVSDTRVGDNILTDKKAYAFCCKFLGKSSTPARFQILPQGCQNLYVYSYPFRIPQESLHTSASRCRFLDARDKDHHTKEKELVVHQGQYFDDAAKKARDKKTFQEAIVLYIQRNKVYR